MWDRNALGNKTVAGTPVKPAWQMPAELRRYIPRPVELSAAGQVLATLTVVLLAGAVALGIGLQLSREGDSARAAALDREGVTAQAEVVTTGIRRDEGRLRFLVYRYTADGRVYQGRQTLRRGDLRPVSAGSAVAVRYLPAEPGRSWLLGYEPRGGPPTVLVILGPAGLVFVAWLLTLEPRSQWRLLSEGQATEARVVGTQRIRSQHSDGFRVEFEFRVLSGATRTVKLDSQKKPGAPGTAATLLYDSDEPRRARLYPLSLVRVARNL